jgi:hypothetical protein
MIRLEQPKNYPSADTMAVEIEVLPLETPEHRYANMRVRYLIGDRQVLEMGSSIYAGEADRPLTWLKKSIGTRRNLLSETFGNLVTGEHLIVIEQSRLSKDDFAQIQKEHGAEGFPYPFLYTLDVLVNPDAEGLIYAGIGMHFTGLSQAEITRFLAQLRDEVNGVFSNARLNQAT